MNRLLFIPSALIGILSAVVAGDMGATKTMFAQCVRGTRGLE